MFPVSFAIIMFISFLEQKLEVISDLRGLLDQFLFFPLHEDAFPAVIPPDWVEQVLNH